MGDLASVSDAREWLGVGANTDDDELQRLVTAVSAHVESYLNRTILAPAGGYQEYRNGKNTTALMLINRPVTAVTNLWVDGTPIPARPVNNPPNPGDPLQAGYTFDDRFVYLNGYCFTKGYQNVLIYYQAGFPSVPFDLAQAVLEIIGIKYKSKTRIGETSKSMAGGAGTVAFFKDVPPDTMRMIDQYRQVVEPT